MFRLKMKESKTGLIYGINDFVEILGNYFFDNHLWKVHLKENSGVARSENETTISGRELLEIIKEDKKPLYTSFAAIEGAQIAFRITAGETWIVETMQSHWVDFFEEKFSIIEKKEIDSKSHEFDEFVQD